MSTETETTVTGSEQVTPTRQETGSSGPGTTLNVTIAGSSRKGTALMTGEKTALVFLHEEMPAELREEAPPAPVERLFPHWEDHEVEQAAAVLRLARAHADLEKLAEFACGEGVEVPNLTSLAESSLFAALGRSEFNPALYAAVSFCAWAVRNTVPFEVDVFRLAALRSAVLELRENPFLEMRRATELIDELRKSGWNGESPSAKAFLDALGAEEDADDEAFALR